jgi:hypothetical protein
MVPHVLPHPLRSVTDERGMGLVGLVVVVAVLAGMVAIAVVAVGSTSSLPAATGSTAGTGGTTHSGGIGGLAAGAGDEVAQQNLSGALAAADQVAVSGDGYGVAGVAALAASTRGLHYVGGPSTGAEVVSVAPSPAGGSVTMAVHSASGTCWLAWRSAATTWYGKGPAGTGCAAVAMSSPPTAGTAPGGVRWRQGSYP